MLRNIGIILGIAGILASLTGALWQLLFPTPDANIGAGLLVVVGLPPAAIGVLLVILSVVMERRKSHTGAQ